MNLVSSAETICRVHSKDILIELFEELYRGQFERWVANVLNECSYQPSTLINAPTWNRTIKGCHYWTDVHTRVLNHEHETNTEELGF